MCSVSEDAPGMRPALLNTVKLSSMGRGIDRSQIVTAAFAVLDERGLDKLTVRAVAEVLGVRAPALYWHVRDKEALLDEMGTRVWSEIATSLRLLPGDDWRSLMERNGHATRDGLLAHRDGARALPGTSLTDVEPLRAHEAVFAWLEPQGFTTDAATDAFSVLTAFVVGHSLEEQERAQAPVERYDPELRGERVDAARYPRVAASGTRLQPADPDAVFAARLEAVLAGIGTLRTPEGSRH